MIMQLSNLCTCSSVDRAVVSGTMCGGSIPRCQVYCLERSGVPVRCIKEDKNLDNFREWLSDNLRYFMLGGAILLIVVVLFFGYPCIYGKREGRFQQGYSR